MHRNPMGIEATVVGMETNIAGLGVDQNPEGFRWECTSI